VIAWRLVPTLLALLVASPLPASAAEGGQESAGQGQEEKISPEERMRRRFPQKVRVGDLIGRPLLDDDDRTLGHVREVVRTAEGKVLLIVPSGGLFGFGERLVAVPIELVAALGPYVAAVDMPSEDFAKAPTWYGANSEPVGRDEIIRIAITRR
jgi:hypothetical protein